jgi:hypothetical protein
MWEPRRPTVGLHGPFQWKPYFLLCYLTDVSLWHHFMYWTQGTQKVQDSQIFNITELSRHDVRTARTSDSSGERVQWLITFNIGQMIDNACFSPCNVIIPRHTILHEVPLLLELRVNLQCCNVVRCGQHLCRQKKKCFFLFQYLPLSHSRNRSCYWCLSLKLTLKNDARSHRSQNVS